MTAAPLLKGTISSIDISSSMASYKTVTLTLIVESMDGKQFQKLWGLGEPTKVEITRDQLKKD